MKKYTAILSIIALTLFIAGCTQNSAPQSKNTTEKKIAQATTAPTQQSVQNPGQVAAAETEATNAAANDATIKEINIESFSYGFNPNKIEVNQGDKVKLNIKNTGGFHNFIIEAFNIKQQTPEGQTTTVEFTADKKGSFEFKCGVGQHASMGQKGTLIVR